MAYLDMSNQNNCDRMVTNSQQSSKTPEQLH